MGWSKSTLAAAAGAATIGLSLSGIALDLGPLAGLSASQFTAATSAGQAAATAVTITDAPSVTAALAYRRVLSLTIDPTCAIAVSLPNLRRCGNVSAIGSGQLGVEIDAAVSCATMHVEQCGSMTDFSMDSLETISGDLIFDDQGAGSALGSLSQPKLRTIGGLQLVTTHDSMGTIIQPLLTTVGGNYTVAANANMTSISAPSIATVGGDLSITGNVAFTAASLTLTALRTVGAGNAGAVTITGNATAGVNGLTDAVATALVAQLIGPPAYSGASTINTNDA